MSNKTQTRKRLAGITAVLSITVYLLMITVSFFRNQARCDQEVPYQEHYYDLFLGCRIKHEGEWFTRDLNSTKWVKKEE